MLGVRDIKSGYELTDNDRAAIQEGIRVHFNGRFNAELETVRANHIYDSTVRVCGFFIPRDAGWKPIDEPMYFFAGSLSAAKNGESDFDVITTDAFGVDDANERISVRQACGAG